MSMSDFDRQWQLVAPAIEAEMGKTFSYRRGSLSCSIVLSLATHEIQAVDEDGLVQTWQGHAFIGEADDLILGGQQVSPLRGDQIVETLASGNVNVYTVSPPAKRREYEAIDAEAFQIVIYTELSYANVAPS